MQSYNNLQPKLYHSLVDTETKPQTNQIIATGGKNKMQRTKKIMNNSWSTRQHIYLGDFFLLSSFIKNNWHISLYMFKVYSHDGLI